MKTTEKTVKHTAGPWETQFDSNKQPTVWNIVSQQPFTIVATVKDGSYIKRHPNLNESPEANAKLIAAAPELLEALNKILDTGEYNDDGDFILSHAGWDGKADPPDTSEPECLTQATKAIAKATN